MDSPDDTFIVTSKIAGAMNYPSTTQALFALIVMIIVLLFILVYCCWGTFSCARQDDVPHRTNIDENAAIVREIQGPGGRGSRMVIVPFNNMIYVGDPESRRIYEIPIEQDKPPAYTEVYDGTPPPPYSTDGQRQNAPEGGNTNSSPCNTEMNLPELPPSYEDCLASNDVNKKLPGILQSLMAEQSRLENENRNRNQSGEMLVTQLPALRMPAMLRACNNNLNARLPNSATSDDAASLELIRQLMALDQISSIPAAAIPSTENGHPPNSSPVAETSVNPSSEISLPSYSPIDESAIPASPAIQENTQPIYSPPAYSVDEGESRSVAIDIDALTQNIDDNTSTSTSTTNSSSYSRDDQDSVVSQSSQSSHSMHEYSHQM